MAALVVVVLVGFYAFGWWAGSTTARDAAWSVLTRRAWDEPAGVSRALWSAADLLHAPWWSIDWGGRWTR